MISPALVAALCAVTFAIVALVAALTSAISLLLVIDCRQRRVRDERLAIEMAERAARTQATVERHARAYARAEAVVEDMRRKVEAGTWRQIGGPARPLTSQRSPKS
jgi:hypothetical protein